MATVFPTCLADTLRPTLAARVVAMLARRGTPAVVARGTTCCGQPAFNAGFVADARRVARRTLRALHRAPGTIVVPSGSCAAMIIRHWPDLFAGTPDAGAAIDVASRAVELSQWLATHTPVASSGPLVTGSTAGRIDPEGDLSPTAATAAVAYHASCHLVRELHAGDAAPQVLEAARIEVRQPARADLCCGFGGTFSVTLAAVSTAMADEKIDSLVATGSSTVVGCDLSCLVHLEGRARARGVDVAFAHLAEVVV